MGNLQSILTTQRALKKVSIIGRINKKEIQLNPHRVGSPRDMQRPEGSELQNREKLCVYSLRMCEKRPNNPNNRHPSLLTRSD